MDISQKLKSIKNGKVIDEVILVVDEDGNIKEITTYKDGLASGQFSRYFGDGQLKVEGFWEDTGIEGEDYRRYGKWTWYNTDGTISSSKEY